MSERGDTLSALRRESLRAFFEPSSIAVVGASPNPARGGYRIVENLLKHFSGQVHAVNPNVDEVLGLHCYPDITSIPGDVDLAVVFIPARAVPDVVQACVEKGVRAVCIQSGGFADAGREGERLQREIEELARDTSTRLWGPNCAGYVSTRPPVSTSFVVTPGHLEPGNVALVAQSGMMAAALLVQILTQELFSISKACSIGNKSDVGESDLLEYLADDSDSDVIALYLESIEDGPRFSEAVDRTIERASVLALVGGRTDVGAGVALSHTGSVAGIDALVAGLLRQHGVLQVDDFMELVELAGALATLGVRAAGNRVAVLTFSGAAGVVTADLFTRHGLVLAELGAATRERLAEIYPSWLEPANPVDVWSTVELHGLERTINHALEALVADDGVDAVLFMPLAFDFFAGADLDSFAAIARAAAKPIVAWPFGEDDQLRVWRRKLREGEIAVCRTLHLAVRVLEALVVRDAGLRRLRELGADEAAGARVSAPWAVPPSPARTIGEEEAKAVLAAHGIPAVEERAAETPAEAVAAAEAIGYPVALKLAAPGLAHKAELDAVALELASADAVRREAERLLAVGAATALAGYRLLLQPMVHGGIETIVGARRDPRLGPAVVFGLGGIFVESLRDVAVRAAPLTMTDARAMIGEVHAAPLLEGGRGRPAADVEAIVSALLAMSRLITTAPLEVQEVEANPLIVRATGEGAVAVDGLIVLSGPRT